MRHGRVPGAGDAAVAGKGSLSRPMMSFESVPFVRDTSGSIARIIVFHVFEGM